jgi:hypothetical protein
MAYIMQIFCVNRDCSNVSFRICINDTGFHLTGDYRRQNGNYLFIVGTPVLFDFCNKHEILSIQIIEWSVQCGEILGEPVSPTGGSEVTHLEQWRIHTEPDLWVTS